MEQYIFLLALGLIWSVFGTVQDLRTREVSNWLNFSLIAFALAYRAFYSVFAKDLEFFISGLVGFVLFFVLAHLFYYGKIFAGGDAKMMMGFGVILPYGNLVELGFLSIAFIFVFFLAGSVWSLIYSIFIIRRNWKKFTLEFKRVFRKSIRLFLTLFVLIILLLLLLDFYTWIAFSIVLIFFLALYVYVKALEVCLIRKVKVKDLREGDWLDQNVKLKKEVIKKSVHGLSFKEIKRIRKERRWVLIKDGIPFTISFLWSLLIMGYVYLFLRDFLAGFF